MGPPVSGDHPAVGERLGGVHSVPGLRRGDPPGHLLHERDRVAERPLPPGGQGPRSFPHRAGGAKVPLPGHQIPRPHRPGTGPLGHEMEARHQRIRYHLRRPVPGRRDLLTQMPETPLARQTRRTLVMLSPRTWKYDRNVKVRLLALGLAAWVAAYAWVYVASMRDQGSTPYWWYVAIIGAGAVPPM